MNRLWSVFLTSGVLFGLSSMAWVHADEPRPMVRSTHAPNAAGIYWQAFSAMPTLKDEHKKRLDAATAKTASALSDDLKPIVDQFKVALHELHRATTVDPCDWQLDNQAGPHLLLPHLQKARDLSRVALLRARLKFAAGENDAAVNDVLAVLRMGRDCGSSPILISFLVDAAIEKTATDVIASDLPRLKTEQLDRLLVSLRGLPPTATMMDCVRWEAQHYGGWLERTVDAEAARIKDPSAGGALLLAVGKDAGLPDELTAKDGDAESKRRAEILKSLTIAEVRTSVQRLRGDYEALTNAMALDIESRTARLAQLEAEIAKSRKLATRNDALRYVSIILLPSLGRVSDREQQVFVRRQLMEQAIQVQRQGPTAVQPIGGKKVEHHKTETGFELRFLLGDKPEVLTVGGGK
jgi:hypothetical protein